MRSEVLWPRPYTLGFQIEYLHSSVVNIYGLSTPRVWLLPYNLLYISHDAVLVLC